MASVLLTMANSTLNSKQWLYTFNDIKMSLGDTWGYKVGKGAQYWCKGVAKVLKER